MTEEKSAYTLRWLEEGAVKRLISEYGSYESVYERKILSELLRFSNHPVLDTGCFFSDTLERLLLESTDPRAGKYAELIDRGEEALADRELEAYWNYMKVITGFKSCQSAAAMIHGAAGVYWYRSKESDTYINSSSNVHLMEVRGESIKKRISDCIIREYDDYSIADLFAEHLILMDELDFYLGSMTAYYKGDEESSRCVALFGRDMHFNRANYMKVIGDDGSISIFRDK